MLNRTRVAQRSLAFLLGASLLCVLGCSGDDGLGQRYAVSGTVKYKGQPVEKARISFVPNKPGGQGAYGEVENGSFSLTTITPGDGALPGEYKVTVDTRALDEEKMKAEAAKLAKKHGMEGMPQIPPELQGKALREAKSSTPGKYQIAGTSDLTAKVEEQSNSFEFELKD